MVDVFYFFSYFFGLKSNFKKSEIASVGALKGVQVAFCGLRCVYLNNDTLKILGTHFSYNEKLKEEKINFYQTVTDIQQVLNIWKMINLTLEGKIAIFKTIAISKIAFQSFIATVPKHIINELEEIQKAFLWKYSNLR